MIKMVHLVAYFFTLAISLVSFVQDTQLPTAPMGAPSGILHQVDIAKMMKKLAITHTMVGKGSANPAGKDVNPTEKQLLDEKTAELIKLHILQVRCPNSVEELPLCLKKLEQRIAEIRELM